jgi:hypothetical protein
MLLPTVLYALLQPLLRLVLRLSAAAFPSTGAGVSSDSGSAALIGDHCMAESRLRVVFALAAVLLTTGSASAARVRYHYVPATNGGPMTLAPIAPNAPGERISIFGRSPYCSPPPRATCVVTFRHPGSGCVVGVPLALPPDTPNLEHRGSRIVYNYGSYTVEVAFIADGSVDVIYNNGLLRDI